MSSVTFFASGVPASKGSKNGVYRGGRVVMYEATSKKLGPWMRAMRRTADHAITGMGWRMDGAMEVRLRFFLPRPQHHFGRRAGKPYLRPDAPMRHVTKSDIDKLARAALDALTACCWNDDMQVASLTATKEYAIGDRIGAEITIERAE